MFSISTTVDGVFHSDNVEPRMLLVHYLRTRLGRAGTVIGCDTSKLRGVHRAAQRPESHLARASDPMTIG
jgi:aerobic-type carbon monoxide dehydrogenase small subunit (CoxS/CutS family)